MGTLEWVVMKYLSPFSFPSVLTSLTVPAAEKHNNSMMLPPPYFTAGMVLGRWWVVPGFFQTWRLELWPNSSILVSSDLRILFLLAWELMVRICFSPALWMCSCVYGRCLLMKYWLVRTKPQKWNSSFLYWLLPKPKFSILNTPRADGKIKVSQDTSIMQSNRSAALSERVCFKFDAFFALHCGCLHVCMDADYWLSIDYYWVKAQKWNSFLSWLLPGPKLSTPLCNQWTSDHQLALIGCDGTKYC